jgi:hypothetical protein
MPKSWYDLHSIKIDYENDSEEEIKRKELYKKICAHKKPFFFAWNYTSLKVEHDKYMRNVERQSMAMFKMQFKDLIRKEDKTEDEQGFIKWAQDKLSLDMSPSIMNRICWAVEDEMDSLKVADSDKFDCNIIKSGYNYSKERFHDIEKEYKEYKSQISKFAKELKSGRYIDCDGMDDNWSIYLAQLEKQFVETCTTICTNEYELCDIFIDLCYKNRNSKAVVWLVCGDTIIKNLLKKNNNNMYFPKKVISDEEFWCKGKKFVMQKVKIGGDIE